MVNQLHRWALGPTSRAYYDEILNAVSGFAPSVKLPGGLDHTAAFEVFRLVLHDNPRIIWADTHAVTVEGPGGVVGMELTYLRGQRQQKGATLALSPGDALTVLGKSVDYVIEVAQLG